MKWIFRSLAIGVVCLLFYFGYTEFFIKKEPKSMLWVESYDLEPGTKAMVTFLDTINNWHEYVIEDSRAIHPIKKFIHQVYMPNSTKLYQANLKLYEGNTDEVIESIEKLFLELEESDALYLRTAELLAIAHLRKGEEINCLKNHNNNSCVLPIQQDGIYTVQENSRSAIELYSILIKRKPNDWRYRWLLNIAYQTLGEYPEKVPKEWLIKSDLMLDKDLSNNFINIAPLLGLDDKTSAGGAVLDDFNNDYRLDVFTSGMSKTQLKYYTNSGNKGFVDETLSANLKGLTGGFNLYQLDYNNDGWLDLFVVRGAWKHGYGLYPNSLLKNNQDGTFTDITVEVGLLSNYPVAVAVCADFNNDGWTDIYVGNESRKNTDTDRANELFLNDGKGKFMEVAAESGLDLICLTKGISAGDFNNDGKTDIFISNRGGRNFLLQNMGFNSSGIPQFKDVSKQASIENPKYSFTSWFWDYNNDGWQDLFVSSYEYGKGQSAASAAKHYAGVKDSTGRPYVYHNNGDGTFTNKAELLGLDFPLNTMAANFGDVNNDGWLDFYIGTGEPDYMGIHPNRLIINIEGKRFKDVTSELGVGHIQKGHGIAFGDIDHDGDQDILAEMGGTAEGDEFQNALFQNPGNNSNWIKLKLVGTSSAKDAIGAKIKIVASEGDSIQTYYRVVSSGGSFGSNSLQQIIGLGSNTRIDSIIVIWPNSNAIQVFNDVLINNLFVIEEQNEIKKINLSAINFNQKKILHHR